MKSKTQRWFSVKSVCRWIATGAPVQQNRAFTADSTLVEERIVLFKAKNYDHAIMLAEREAKEYSKGSYRNIFGQRVRLHFLKTLECYELFDPPVSGTEIYSQTELVSSSVTNHEVKLARFGQTERKSRTLNDNPRIKFGDLEVMTALYERDFSSKGKRRRKQKSRTA